MGPAVQAREAISFGPFRLVEGERLLIKEDARVELGARALDILIALVSRPNEILSKKDLLALAWPDVTVEEGSLRFHIASLRKALGDGVDGARYISTMVGRGYCFVAPISRSSDCSYVAAPIAISAPLTNLPVRLSRMVGRTDDVSALSTQLIEKRFVTIVGPGGVGKTTVAAAVGHDLVDAFLGAVLFVDLGALRDPRLAATAIASMLGLSVLSEDPTPSLIAYLRNRRLLLIIDTCEHLIETAAALTSCIFVAAPQVHILATSREALRVEGEQVYKLEPLACPPDHPGLTAAVIQTYPAVQLFMERAAASGARLVLSDADATIVARICRKLDGMALAIELAAGRVEAYGLELTAALLNQRLTLLLPGQRIAPPRQKTLQATLDWSYGLLSGLERMVLRRLTVFVAHFTIDAALAVATGAIVDQGRVFGAIDSLIAKSMVATRPVGAMMRYRLLDTTRAYALETSGDDSEFVELAIRHANYYRMWLEQTGVEWPTLSSAAERVPHFAGLANVRAALEWCFGAGGNVEVGVGLASAAAPVLMAMSLLPECHRWSARAILALDDATRGGSEEMHLQAALGMSLMFMRGESDEARLALNRSLAIAEERGDTLNQVLLLGPLHMFHLRVADFKAALQFARHGAALAGGIDDPAPVALAHCLLGISLHLAGEHGGARAALEAALRDRPGPQWTSTIYLGFEGQILAGALLARSLWLQGHPVQALERAHQTVEDAGGLNHPVTLSVALIWAISVLLWTGELQSAGEHIDRFISHAESFSLGPYLAVGRGLRGELAIRRGDAKGGVEALQSCLAALHEARYELLTSPFNIALAQGLGALGRVGEGLALVEAAIRRVEANGDHCYLPELLRVQGGLLLLGQHPSADGAESCFLQALELSRHQAARAWELRTGVDLAALWAAQGHRERARALLLPVFEQFREGSGTADLQAAGNLLASLGA